MQKPKSKKTLYCSILLNIVSYPFRRDCYECCLDAHHRNLLDVMSKSSIISSPTAVSSDFSFVSMCTWIQTDACGDP